MWVRFDRAIVAVPELEAAVDDYARLLGREPLCFEAEGGAGARFQLGNGALELRGAGPAEASGPWGIALGADDAAECRQWLEERGFATHPEKRELRAENGSTLRSLELELDPARTRGVRILGVEQVEPEAGVAQSSALGDERAVAAGLDHIVLRTPDADAAIALYRDALGIRLALDRSFPERGTRLCFLRVAGVTLELAARMGAAPGAGSDAIWGIAYQVPDPRAARERVAAAGLDVSELRRGNKAGTSVCTVRSGTWGVPTLLIGPELA